MLKAASVTIVRDGVLTNIDEAALCKGDTLVFQAGDLVPADLRLVEAENLQVDEFELTGEIMPVSKRVDGGDSDATVYRGSRVLKGTGKGIVLATGDETEYGRVLRQPWQRRRHFTLGLPDRRQLLLVGLLLPPLVGSLSKSPDWALTSACYVLLALVILLLQNDELLKYMLVSSGLKRMDRSRIDVLDWTAPERMGDIDTICFDKTGVLTSRYIEVKHVYAGGEPSNRDLASGKFDPSNLITTASALCNDVLYYEGLGRTNPVDRALISFATRNGVDFGELP